MYVRETEREKGREEKRGEEKRREEKRARTVCVFLELSQHANNSFPTFSGAVEAMMFSLRAR